MTIKKHLIDNNSLRTNGSMKNGTVCNGVFLAAIKKRLYFCSAFETQMLKIEY